jgi:hypothetical protein
MIDLSTGSGPLEIDASSMIWASPVDLTAIAAMASAAAPNGVRLTLPADVDVAQYLARMNVVTILNGLGGSVTGPATLTMANPLADRLLEVRQLHNSGEVGAFGSDVYQLVNAHAGHKCAAIFHTMLGELLDNTTQHAQSPVGAFGAAQVHSGVTSGRAGVEVAVADAGVGILQSLRTNPEYANLETCTTAIQSALRRGVSSEAGEPNRGDGLSRVAHRLREHGGKLVLRSGDGLARVTPGGRKFAGTETITPGTWAWLWIDLAVSPSDGQM